MHLKLSSAKWQPSCPGPRERGVDPCGMKLEYSKRASSIPFLVQKVHHGAMMYPVLSAWKGCKIIKQFNGWWFEMSWCSWDLMGWRHCTWWRHQMEPFSALLAICAGNSPVPGKFPAQRPVTRSFDVLFDLRPNKRLSKQWWGWWFETPPSPLWCHCNEWAGWGWGCSGSHDFNI